MVTLVTNLMTGLIRDLLTDTGGSPPPVGATYRRPGGVFLYHRPDGTSIYLRP